MDAKKMKVRSFADFKTQVETSDNIKKQFTDDPLKFLNDVEDKSPMQDKSVFLKIVYIVGITLLLCIIVSAIISLYAPVIEYTAPDGKTVIEKREIDSFFVMIASASIGALAGLLVPTPKSDQ